MISARENWLRAIEFRCPEWIPCSVGFAPVTWCTYRQDLERIVLDHPRLFPGHRQGGAHFFDDMPPAYREGETFRDQWGCLWRNIQGGLEGQVVEHPLADWDALDDYQLPDPLTLDERGPRDWEATHRGIEAARAAGQVTGGHAGRLFDRLYFLRGFENLMVDLALDEPRLTRLIERLTEHSMAVVNQWLAMDVDYVSFHTDIGAQTSLMISAGSFRRHIKPMFATLFQACRRAGAHVLLSSDGHLLEIVDDLIECGVSMHDPQLRANTLDGIVRHYRGRLCATVDLDRQSFPFLTPAGIRAQVGQVVDAMATAEGGLMLSGSIWGADVPLANIEALCAAMEEYCLP